MRWTQIIVTAALAIARGAGAHPGHGDPARGHGLEHHLTEPVHVLTGLALVAAVLVLGGILRRDRRA
jgi:hypothetical protein